VFHPGLQASPGDVIEAECVVSLRPGVTMPDYRVCGRFTPTTGSERAFDWSSPVVASGFRGSPFYDDLFVEGWERRFAAPAPKLDAGALRRSLLQSLPAWMVPTTFVAVQAIPRGPSGKIDKAALPDPLVGRSAAAAAYAPPQNSRERAIGAIWAEVLQLDRVGVQDNFFDLGGHSLLLVKLRARLEATLGRAISVIDLFRHPTVAAQARHLGEANGAIAPQAGFATGTAY
jgi:aryl carrier-like protein